MQDIERICERHSEFKAHIEKHPKAKNVRQQGTIVAVEFLTNTETSYFNDLRDKLYYFFLENGVLLRPLGNVIYVMPPYCMTDAQLKKIYGLIERALDEIA